MPVEVIMPKVDMDMANGIIAQWHAKEGDTVVEGEPLFDIETDKSNMEVEAPATGVLKQVMASHGDTVDIGVCIAQIYAQGETLVLDAVDTEQDLLSAERSEGVQVSENSGHIPTLNIDTGSRGYLSNFSSRDSSNNAGLQRDESISATDAVIDQAAINDHADKIRATPLARKIANQLNVPLNSLTGSGPRGRITKHDVESAVKNNRLGDTGALSMPSMEGSTEQLDALGIAYIRQPVGRMRAIIARRLTDSKSSVPHFYLESDCRVDKLQAYRKQLNEALENDNLDDSVSLKISLNDLIVMAAAKALEAVPEANVSWAGTEVIQYRDANISVAVSVEGGLMTPVVREAQTKSIKTLSAQLRGLSERARSGKLSPEEYQGGSMSITNLGMFGVQRFQAIINPPEAMILAVGAASRQIVVDSNNEAAVGNVMSVCLSCDHRVLDGVVAARWLQAFQARIENPIQLML